MYKISVIHFQPLEFFPPALNFVRYLADQAAIRVSVYTTRQSNQTFRAIVPGTVNLKATKFSGKGRANRIIRALKYLQFNMLTILRLLVERPDAVVYFDPYSAMPGIAVHLLKNRKSRLWIHFHEYFPPDWYSQGMLMTRVTHFLEKHFIFRSVLGISQTNAERVRLFLGDHPEIEEAKVFSFPNYPPYMWGQYHRRIDAHESPIKMVALGSFTLRGTYLAEVCQWVEGHRGAIELDIYSLYFDDETEEFLNSIDSRWVRFHSEGIAYDQIPSRFAESAFHIGLVLYKCNHPNTIHCVSNKVFEYLACGLDVWYPTGMIGTAPYATEGVYPKVLPVDFQRLEELKLDSLLSREGHSYLRKDFACESVYSDWVAKLIGSR